MVEDTLSARQLPAFSQAYAPARDAGELAKAAGYAAGWSAGSAAARKAAQQQAAAAAQQRDQVDAADRERVAHCLRALQAASASVAQAVEPDVQALTELVLSSATELATALLGRELAAGSEAGRDAMRRAMQSVPVRPTAVHLNPADAALLRDHDVPTGLQIVADPQVAAGDSRAFHPAGRVEVRLADNLASVRAALGQQP